MYSCVDKLEAKLSGRLRRQKERIKSHKQRTTFRFLGEQPPVTVDVEDYADDEQSVDASYVINFERARQRLEESRRV